MFFLSRRIAAALFIVTIVFSGLAASQDLAGVKLIVARSNEQMTAFGTSVILTKSLPDGSNVGFILNRPTPITLGEVSEQVPIAKQREFVFFGGPILAEHLFALVKTTTDSRNGLLQISPHLFIVTDGTIVDQIILSESTTSRILAGMLIWTPGELDEELKQGLWGEAQAEEELILGTAPEELWVRVLQRTAMRR